MYQWLYQGNPYRAYPLFALIVFLAFFMGVFVWAYWPRNRSRFDHNAALPFDRDAALPLEDGDER